jgi:hypothetical protein
MCALVPSLPIASPAPSHRNLTYPFPPSPPVAPQPSHPSLSQVRNDARKLAERLTHDFAAHAHEPFAQTAEEKVTARVARLQIQATRMQEERMRGDKAMAHECANLITASQACALAEEANEINLARKSND